VEKQTELDFTNSGQDLYLLELKLLTWNKSTLFYGKSVAYAKGVLPLCIRVERFHNYQQHITTQKAVRVGEPASLQRACTTLNLSNMDEFGASFAVLLIYTELPKNPD